MRVIPLSAIASLCNLSMDGVPFRGGLNAHESWESYSLQEGLVTIGYRGNVVGKLSVNLVPTEIRILHYLLTYTILPRGGNHGVIQHEDVLVMWAMLKGYKICWPFFLIQHMLKFQGKTNKPIGYADPSEPPSNQPSLREIMQAIQNMELNMNQRMDNYQASIDQRFQTFEREQRKIWRSIRRMEAWTFNEELDEDDNQDEDDD
ncbi:hypothetical protein PIB30_108234 [Stylosanthes scabra]|uniref:Uncharacterized protein n=1 Tax=Stylosanthes scabra TaxID=79078 RepID=A0ABU6Y0Q2_9FABA|nr:hypothetical protein [Stylosanthes scabra]